jgi:hypothetical protein
MSEMTSKLKNTREVGRATCPEPESCMLAMEVTCSDTVLSPGSLMAPLLLNGKLHLKYLFFSENRLKANQQALKML